MRLARLRGSSSNDLRFLWDLSYCSKPCQKLHWKAGHKEGSTSRCSTGIAKVLLPLDNEPHHGGVAEVVRRWMDETNDLDEGRKIRHGIREIKPRRGGGTELQEYYLNREMCEAMISIDYMGDREDLGLKSFQKLVHLVDSAPYDPYREKVAQEMLLCELMLQHRICCLCWW
jgi:hypothetical protein